MPTCSFGHHLLLLVLQANNNEPLQIVCGYHALPLPSRGGEIIFHPLDHLQPIKYCRPGMSSLGLDAAFADVVPSSPKEVNEVMSSIGIAILTWLVHFLSILL